MGKDKQVSSHEAYFGHKSNKVIGLHLFGELAVIKVAEKHQSKLKQETHNYRLASCNLDIVSGRL